MKRLGKAVIAVGVLALGTGACFSDPTSDLRNGATRLQFNRSYILQAPGNIDTVTISVRDDQGNLIPFDEPALATANAAIAEIAPLPDSTLRFNPGNTLYKAVIEAIGAGQSYLRVTAGGITDSIAVVVTPATIAVSQSPAAPRPGDTITITVTEPNVTFSNTATAVFNNGSGFFAFISRSATELKYRAGAEGTGTVTVSGAVLLGSIPLSATTSAGTITVAPEASEPANNAIGGGAMLAYPAINDSVVVYGSISELDIDDWWRFTTVTADDSVQVQLTWTGGPTSDIDLYVTTGAVPGPFGFAAATGAHPENLNRTLTAGGVWGILVEFYDAHGAPTPIGYRLRLTRRN